MEHWLFLFSENLIYSIPLSIVFILGLLELVLSFVGLGFSNVLDDYFPDTDLNGDTSSISEVLNFVNKGNIPTVMLLLTSLTIFGLLGLIFQNISFAITGSLITNWILAPLTFVAAIPILTGSSIILSKILPRDETTAISTNTFIGKIAQITLGTASKDKSAEAKLTDMYKEVHYFRVKPINDEIYQQGEKVIIMERESPDGNVFIVKKDPNEIVK